MSETCERCKFWKSIFGMGVTGECRAKSPILVTRYGHKGERHTEMEWPNTQGSDWCGDFKQRPAPEDDVA